MKKSRTLTSKLALLGTSVALVGAGWVVTAHAANGEGYATDASGKLIRNVDGACTRTGAWTPALADPSCEAGKAPVLVMSKAVVGEPAAPKPAAVVPTVPGYATDGSGKIQRNASGLCWRTASWTPALAVAECEGGAAPVAAAPKAAEPVAAAPAPAAKAPAAAAPAPMTVSSDGLFDFGKSTLRKGSNALLAPIAAKLKSAGKVSITGHTDRIGNAKSNMALSKARAESVKTYLAKNGVAASAITTEGVGSSAPVTKADQCKGNKTPAVVTCLQPDRRVVITAQ